MSGKGHLTQERTIAIYRETIVPLYGYVSRRCGGDRTLAEDVTQETWLRAVREWRRNGVPDRPIAWLTKVAHNLLASYFRRKPLASLASVSSEDVLTSLADRQATESSEVSAMVGYALARLPADQAQILEAFHLEDRRMAQIAESMGVSERAVEGRLRRARQRLRRELEAVMGIAGGRR